jgi:CDP-L-myo-inositol myo-inositolphosphotransferase
MSCLKGVDLWLNRPLAALVVRLVYKTRITPNQITVFSLLLGLTAAGLFAIGQAVTFVAGGILLQVSSVIDGADGMLARSRGECSRYGGHLDLLCDRLVDFSAIAGLALGALRFGFPLRVAVLGLLAAGLYCLQVTIYYLLKAYLRIPDSGETGEARAVAIWIILIATVSLQVDLLLYAMLSVTLVINASHLWRFLRAPRGVK